MKNWFKKILAITTFLLISSFAQAQEVVYFDNTNYNQWIQIGDVACGKASFHLYVNQYYNQTDGLYYYEIYVWSDSYYKNCNPSYTYIENVIVYVYDGSVYSNSLSMDYYLASPKTTTFNGWNYLAYVYSASANQKFKIAWDGANPY